MAAIPKLDDTHLEALCAVIGDTTQGLTGSEIGRLLERRQIDDPFPGTTKRMRLYEALRARQEKDGYSNNVLAFVEEVLTPVRFRGNTSGFEDLQARVNEVLAFSGYAVGDDGKLRASEKARTLSEAEKRAGTLRQKLLQRQVHHDVLRFCRAELVQENYFHAVFEATKSVAQKIRDMTGIEADGAELVDIAFGLRDPLLAINSLRTETERSEQSGFANLIKGAFGLFRNVPAHTPKIMWPIDEQDALDLLSTVSLVHRRLDRAIRIPKS